LGTKEKAMLVVPGASAELERSGTAPHLSTVTGD
jgi:hypothetical protein